VAPLWIRLLFAIAVGIGMGALFERMRVSALRRDERLSAEGVDAVGTVLRVNRSARSAAVSVAFSYTDRFGQTQEFGQTWQGTPPPGVTDIGSHHPIRYLPGDTSGPRGRPLAAIPETSQGRMRAWVPWFAGGFIGVLAIAAMLVV
jgi:hypothetical protein